MQEVLGFVEQILDWMSDDGQQLKVIAGVFVLGLVLGALIGSLTLYGYFTQIYDALLRWSAGLLRSMRVVSLRNRSIHHHSNRILHRRRSNAFVTNTIEESTQFVDRFFGEPFDDKTDEYKGEIWLFQTDLAAFKDHLYFRRLYKERALKWNSVDSVKAVVSSSLKADYAGENGEEEQDLLSLWKSVKKNLEEVENLSLRGKVKMKFRDEVGLDKVSSEFFSEENWVLYVKWHERDHLPKVLVHRRRIRASEHSYSDYRDERIIVTGSFPEEGQLSSKDPVVLFLRESHFNNLSRIFTSSEGWSDLYTVAQDQIRELERPSGEKSDGRGRRNG